MTHAHHATEDTFDAEVLQSNVPVLVDFYADWCAPCQAVAPVVEDLAGAYEGQAKVVKVDIDSAPSLATTYNVRSIPTLLFVHNGKVVDQVNGAASKSVLEDRLKKVVGQVH